MWTANDVKVVFTEVDFFWCELHIRPVLVRHKQVYIQSFKDTTSPHHRPRHHHRRQQ